MSDLVSDLVPVVYLVATVFTLLLAGLVFAHARSVRGAAVFSWMMLAVSVWLFTGFMEDLAIAVPARIRWSQVQYFGVVTVAPLWFLFAMERSGWSPPDAFRRRLVSGIWFFPGLVLLLALTHSVWNHRWVWPSIVPLTDSPGSRLVYAHGPAVWALALYSYVLVLWGCLLHLRVAFRADRLYRNQAVLLAVGAAFPVVGNLVYLAGFSPIPGVDTTPLALAVSGALLAWGAFRYRLFSLEPVAHDALFRDMADGAIVIDETGRIREANPAARDLLSLPAQWVGRPAGEALAGWPDLVRVAAADTPGAEPLRFTPSPNVLYSAQAIPLGHRGKSRGRLILLRDVSAEAQSLRALHRRDAILEAVRSSADILLRETPVARVLPRVLALLGSAVEADWAFASAFPGTDEVPAWKHKRLGWIRTDEVPLPAEVLAPPWIDRLRRGETLVLQEDSVSAADGGLLRGKGISSLLAVPIRARDIVWGAVGFGGVHGPRAWSEADISALWTAAQTFGAALDREWAETEQQRLKDKLFEVQKLESIGRLAGGIAHDFNNLLQAILGFSEMLASSLSATDARRSDVQEIQTAARRATLLTQRLLAFGRKQIIQPEPLDLNAMLRGMEDMVRRMIGDPVTVSFSLDPFLPTVTADAGSLTQAVTNIVVNARDAMPKGGRITVRTGRVKATSDTPGRPADAAPGDYAVISIADTGMGIDSAILPHLFEPFYSTKPGQPSAGMGLPTAYGIVRQHGGWMALESELGRGTTVRLFLPAGVVPSPAPAPIPPVSSSPSAHRVLLIEDEPSVQKLASRLLAKEGYEVHSAATLSEARRVFEAENGAFSILFSDIVLPDGNGLDLAEALVQQKPDLAVVVTTGYVDETMVPASIGKRGWVLLRKPWQPSDLLRVIRESGRACTPPTGSESSRPGPTGKKE